MKTSEITVSKNFADRMRSMLRLDFYRLFHTPLYYIMISIAAIIPAMMLSMTGDAYGGNTWHVVAPETPIYIINDMGQLGSINMIYIFGGIMLAIFIGHDYTSGFVKSIFTSHAKKRDYIFSKAAIGLFSMLSMTVTYMIGTLFAGVLSGSSFEVSASGLFFCLLSKLVMCVAFSLLYTSVSVFFRRKFGLAITASFFFGTGILVMAAAAMLGESSPIVKLFMYGSAATAALDSTPATLLYCLVMTAVWSAVYAVVSTFILNHRDLA